MTGSLDWFALIDGQEVWLGRREVPAPIGEGDAWINQAVLADFETNMKSAGKKLTVLSFDADHAFANPSNPKFDPKAASEARKQAVAYVKKHLK